MPSKALSTIQRSKEKTIKETHPLRFNIFFLSTGIIGIQHQHMTISTPKDTLWSMDGMRRDNWGGGGLHNR